MREKQMGKHALRAKFWTILGMRICQYATVKLCNNVIKLHTTANMSKKSFLYTLSARYP